MPDAGTAPGVGHNSLVGMTSDVIRHWVAKIERQKGVKDIAGAQLNKVRKEARAAGLQLEDLKYAMTLRDLPREDALRRLAHLTAYIKALDAPIQGALDFNDPGGTDDDLSDEELEDRLIAKARSDGMMAGLRRADPKENPHAANSPAGQAWLKAHHDGLAAAEREIDPLSDEDTDE